MSEIKLEYKSNIVQPNAPDEVLQEQKEAIAPPREMGVLETFERSLQDTAIGNFLDDVEAWTRGNDETKFKTQESKEEFYGQVVDSFNKLKEREGYNGFIPSADQLKFLIDKSDSAVEFNVHLLNLQENIENKKELDNSANQVGRFIISFGTDLGVAMIPGVSTAKVFNLLKATGSTLRYGTTIGVEALTATTEAKLIASGDGREATSSELLFAAGLGAAGGGLQAKSILKEERIVAAKEVRDDIDSKIREGLEKSTEDLEQMNIQMERSRGVSRSPDEDGDNVLNIDGEMSSQLNSAEMGAAQRNGYLGNNVNINTDITNGDAAAVLNSEIVPRAERVVTLREEVNNIDGSIANLKADLKETITRIEQPIKQEMDIVTSKMATRSEATDITKLVKESGSIDEVKKSNKKSIDRLAAFIKYTTGAKSIKEIKSVDDIKNSDKLSMSTEFVAETKANIKLAKQLSKAAEVVEDAPVKPKSKPKSIGKNSDDIAEFVESKASVNARAKLPEEFKGLTKKQLKAKAQEIFKNVSKKANVKIDESFELKNFNKVFGNSDKIKKATKAFKDYNNQIALRNKISKVEVTEALRNSAMDLQSKMDNLVNEDELVKSLKSSIEKLENQKKVKTQKINREEKQIIKLEEEFQELMKNPTKKFEGVNKEIYQNVKDQITRLSVSAGRQSIKEANAAIKGAEEAGDLETVAKIKDSYYVDDIKVGDFTPEELDDLEKVEDAAELERRMRAERQFVDNVIAESSLDMIKSTNIFDEILDRTLGKLFNTIGYALTKSAEGRLRAFSLRAVKNPLGNADGSVSTLAATDFKDQFSNKFGLRMDAARRRAFFDWAKENQISTENFSLGKKIAPEVFDDYKKFNAEMRRYLAARDNPATFVEKDFSPAIVKGGNEIAAVSKEMDEAVINSSRFLTKEQKAELLKNAGKAVLPRVRNDEAYKFSPNNFTEAEIITAHEQALLKGNILLNHNVEINRLKNLKKPSNEDIVMLEFLEKEAKQLAEIVESGNITDADVRQIMDNWQGKRYSDYLATQYYKNQRWYAVNGSYEGRGAILKMDLDEILDRFGGGADDVIPEETKNVLRLALGRNIEGSSGRTSIDSLQKRVDMDINHVYRTVDGRELKMSDFFIDDIEGAMGQKINRFSGEYGVRMVGYSSLDEFTEELNEIASLSTVTDRERGMLKKVSNNLNGVAQFDQSSELAAVARVLKNLSAYLRLGTLFVSVAIESVNLIAHHGVKDYINAIRPARKMYKAMMNGELSQSDMNSIAMHGGLSYNPIANHLRRSDAGTNILAGEKSGFEKGLDKAQNISATLAKGTAFTYQGLDTTFRIMTAQLSLNKILNASVDQLSDVRMADAGIDSDMIAKIQKIKNDPKYVTRNGKGEIIEIDVGKIIEDDPEFGNSLVASVTRLSDKVIMTTRFSDMPAWYNTPAFFYLGQFRAFMIGSFTNSLRYGIRRPDAISAQMFTFQMAVQSLYYHAKIQHLKEDNPEEYKEASSPEGYFFGTLRMTPQGAALTTIFDFFTGFGFGREFGSTYGSNTGQKGFGWESTTLTKSIDDWFKNITNGAQAITGADSWTENDTKLLRNSLVPNVYKIGQLFGL